MNCRRIKRL